MTRMNSGTAIVALVLASIIVQRSGSTITESEKSLKSVAILIERVSILKDAEKQVTDLINSQVGHKQGLGNKCSCEIPCEEGVCNKVEVQGVGQTDPVCLLEGIDVGIEFVKIKPIECGGCIAADMLGDYASHELVFQKHLLAPVLCDSSGSCATKGHIVKFMDRAMMMSTYCDIVGCEKNVMRVNSPRYSRGLKVDSRSADMHFTAFAARFGTLGEEAVLAAVVHVGL